MVGKTTRRTAGMIGTAAAAIVFATFSAAAQDEPQTRPDAETACPDRPVLEDASPDREAMLSFPAAWADFADMSMYWLAVRTELGSVHCVETTWAIDADAYERLNERFLGFEWSGYEAGGYMLIDTAGTGSSTDTGAKPVFSPEGGYMASIQFSDAGWGGLEGFAVWRTYASGMTPVHVDTNLPTMADWRIDKWEGNGCLHLSAVPYDRVEDWRKLTEYKRDRYVSRSRDGWKLSAGEVCFAS
ncbi:hypothetical protein [Erythrobacter crassostreae]|uniref:Uncharacterized protein n=1 Tax=Erythrobacter crassostreae TaxID=2828328 RepID=A0A9X1F3M8_9SPHN|nr:hypothetical protein [Erythrobacter crassostrea]MBV7259371.1 hypothetical protein [Erythrobacter crassostrea]